MKPDSGHPRGEYSPGQRYWHFSVSADSKALADHEPLSKLPLTQKVMFGVLDFEAGGDSDYGDDDHVADEDDPIKSCDLHERTIPRRKANSKNQEDLAEPCVLGYPFGESRSRDMPDHMKFVFVSCSGTSKHNGLRRRKRCH